MGKNIFLGLFLMGIAVYFFWATYRERAANRRRIAEAQRWPEANARVDSSEVKRRLNVFQSLLIAYSRFPTIIVAYRFQVGDQIYHGNRVAFGTVTTSWATALALQAAYPAGSVIRIRYNPANPRDNVIELREITNLTPVLIIAPAVFLAGLIWLIVALSHGR